MVSREGLWLGRMKKVRLREKNEIKKVIKGGLAVLIGEVALNAFRGKFNIFPLFIHYTCALVYETSNNLGRLI